MMCLGVIETSQHHLYDRMDDPFFHFACVFLIFSEFFQIVLTCFKDFLTFCNFSVLTDDHLRHSRLDVLVP